MKKNITINLCGRLFNIDEDAYELLRHYMDTLRSYFSRQEGGEEIADDIEQRIGELLEDLKSQGVEAVNIDHIKQIITRIGQPEEMDSPTSGFSSKGGGSPEPSPQGESMPQSSPESEEATKETGGEATTEKNEDKASFSDFFDQLKDLFRERRFYRNPKDKMLAGVVSGLASSFEVDVTLLRLTVVAAVLLLSLFGSVFSHHQWMVFLNMNVWLTVAGIYLILALILPEAETPEQQLKMQGKPVNMQNLAEEVVQNVSEKVGQVKQSSGVKSVFNGILRFFVAIFKFLMVLLALALFAGGVFALLFGFFAINSPDSISQFFSWDMQPILEGNQHLFVLFLMALLTALLIPAYAIVQHLIRPLKAYQRLLLLLVWIVAVALAVVTGNMLTMISDRYERSDAIQSNDMVETEDGVTMRLFEMEFLNNHGWRILNGEGCNDRFTARGEYYLNNRHNARYLDCYDEHHRQRYRAEKGESLMPGKYKLTVAARANGRGAFVYTLIDGQKTLQEIPATGNTGGGIWQEAVDSLNHVSAIPRSGDEELARKPAVDYFKEVAHANNGNGYGWNHLVFEPIIIKEPHTVVNYGVTTDPDFTGQSWLGQWFSACDFIIERVEE
ncbi:MAG: PspC domain-containing protein [Prevotella sp.]|nr:PspC domain-containing protein [Prevotella sp.]